MKLIKWIGDNPKKFLLYLVLAAISFTIVSCTVNMVL